MIHTLSQKRSSVLRGAKKVERSFREIAAEPVMNTVAAIDDECKMHARLTRVHENAAADFRRNGAFLFAFEHDKAAAYHRSRAQQLSQVRVALTGAIAATERSVA